jgi:hypothetical protein
MRGARFFRIAFPFAALAAAVYPQDAKVAYKPLGVSLSHEFGSIVNGIAEAETLSGAWIQRTGAWLNFEATMEERLTLRASLGGMFWYSLPEYEKVVDAQTRYFSPNLSTAHGVYAFGDVSDPAMEMTVGFFPYKYNSEVKNLGEYLFRAGAYPGYISTGGLVITKTARASLVGVKFTAKAPAALTHDIIINSSAELFPLYDFSFSYLAGYKTAGGILDIGAGLQLDHYLPIKPSKTSPKNPLNGYITINGKEYVGSPSYYFSTGDSASGTLVQGVMNDSVPDDFKDHISFKAVKLMTRGTFDPKPWFNADIFGKDDLKLYFEAAVLGIQDHPVYYEKIADRVPIMLGFNVPAFKMLDVLSVEVERFTSPYVNSYELVKTENLPVPYVGSKSVKDPKEDDLKWTVYAEKQVVHGFSLIGQVAKDHLRAIQYPGKTDPPEAIRRKDDWHWVMRLVLRI